MYFESRLEYSAGALLAAYCSCVSHTEHGTLEISGLLPCFIQMLSQSAGILVLQHQFVWFKCDLLKSCVYAFVLGMCIDSGFTRIFAIQISCKSR